jgi:serine/threonine protein kinase
LQFIHLGNIVHGDVKLENVMVISTPSGPVIKLIDFGLGHFVDDENNQKGIKGTEAYQSPETIMNQNRDPFKSDIWASGIILFAMLTSRLPFDREEELEAIASSEQGRRSMLRRIAMGSYQYRQVELDNLSDESRDVIKSMLARNQEYRKSAAELLHHAWFS